jgi:Domain of unknown function (DUF4307)
VTEINTTAPIFPPGRYGKRREPGRNTRGRVLLLAVAGALVGLLLAVVLYQRYGTPGYQPQVVHFQTATDHVTMRFQVHKPSGDPATCHVRARNRAGAEVGAADVAVPAGKTVTVTYTLATSGPPVSAEVPVCRKR